MTARGPLNLRSLSLDFVSNDDFVSHRRELRPSRHLAVSQINVGSYFKQTPVIFHKCSHGPSPIHTLSFLFYNLRLFRLIHFLVRDLVSGLLLSGRAVLFLDVAPCIRPLPVPPVFAATPCVLLLPPLHYIPSTSSDGSIAVLLGFDFPWVLRSQCCFPSSTLLDFRILLFGLAPFFLRNFAFRDAFTFLGTFPQGFVGAPTSRP